MNAQRVLLVGSQCFKLFQHIIEISLIGIMIKSDNFNFLYFCLHLQICYKYKIIQKSLYLYLFYSKIESKYSHKIKRKNQFREEWINSVQFRKNTLVNYIGCGLYLRINVKKFLSNKCKFQFFCDKIYFVEVVLFPGKLFFSLFEKILWLKSKSLN